jgi:serine/threonine protein kinase/WD40 repeat protein
MTPSTACPDRSQLQRLIEASLPDDVQEPLLTHLEDCLACRQALEDLAADGASWAGVARHLRPEPTGDHTRERDGVAARRAALGPPSQAGQLGTIDQYDILEEIGRGGMGVVYRAFDRTLHRVVALKLMAPELAVSATARERFKRESIAIAAVSHDHVVTIHGVGEFSGLPYLVMQYVPGLSLQQRLDEGGPLPVKEVLRIGMQTALGLAAAHAQGIVHRDVKPANVLLENGLQRVKITDFGLARAGDDASLTQSGVLTGTPQYMSPEQALAEPVDYRSDLFSLGSVLYTLCTGRPPFRAGGPLAVLKRVAEDTPRPIREINPEVPEGLEAIVNRLMEKHPIDRFQSAAEVARLLEAHLAYLQQPAVPPRPQPPPLPPPLPAAKPEPWRLSCWLRRAVERRKKWEEVAAKRRALAGWLCRRLMPRTLNGWVLLVLLVSMVSMVVILSVRSSRMAALERAYRMHSIEAGRSLLASQPEFVLPTKRKDLLSLALSPNGPRLAAGFEDKSLLVWEWDPTASKQVLLPGRPGPVRSLTFTPDGESLLCAFAAHRRPDAPSCEVQLWDPRVGEEKQRFEWPAGPAHAVAISPDGQQVAAGGENGILVWDFATGKPWPAPRGRDHVLAVAFSPDGLTLAVAGEDRTVRLLVAETGQLRGNLNGHRDAVTAVCFHPDGRTVATGSRDGTVKVWDLSSYQVRSTLEPERGQGVRSLAYSGDGRILAVGLQNQKVRLWEENVPVTRVTDNHNEQVGGMVAFQPGSNLLAIGHRDGTIRLWRVWSAGTNR